VGLVVFETPDINRGVIGLWCVAHMIHNGAHSSINTIPLYIESFVVNIFGYFSIFTVRVKRLKNFVTLLGNSTKVYSNVRWLSVLPAVRRICELYPALQSFLYLKKSAQ
jgi:hypothetical protein